jgi:uncharacterized protein DUF6682
MQIQTIITDVRNELVEANAGFWTDTELLALANRAERDFVQKTRCLEGKAYLSTVLGQQDYLLPNNFLSVIDIFFNTPNTTSGVAVWQKLEIVSLDKQSQLNQNFASGDPSLQGTPVRCFIWNKSLYFDPPPNLTASSNVLMFFKAKPIPMAANTDPINLDDSLSEAINNFVMWKAWKKEQEDAKAAEYQAAFEMNVKQGLRWVKLQDLGNRKRLDLDSPIGFGTSASGFNPFSPTI